MLRFSCSFKIQASLLPNDNFLKPHQLQGSAGSNNSIPQSAGGASSSFNGGVPVSSMINGTRSRAEANMKHRDKKQVKLIGMEGEKSTKTTRKTVKQKASSTIVSLALILFKKVIGK